MNGLMQDLVYGLRMMRKNPGFSLLAVITLALGIGANTAIFSHVDALVLRPFTLPDLDRVVAIWETVPRQNADSIAAAPANFRDWTEQSASFEHLAAVQSWSANLTGEGVAERVEGYRVTSDFFSLLGVPSQIGRQIGEIDFQHGITPVVVVSNGFWQRYLAGDRTIVGKNLLLNGQKFTVIGVASPDIDFPTGAEVWTPLDLNSVSQDRSSHFLRVLGRLRKSVSQDQAGASLQAIAGRLAQQFPDTNGGHGVRVVPLAEDATSGTKQFVWVLMGAAIFVLLLACVNVANLQLARISSRQKEMAVRIGLGASRWQLVRQLLIESTLLSLAGAVAGALFAGWGVQLLRRDLPPFILAHVPGLKNVGVDSRVLFFTLGVAVLAGILAGLMPSLRFSRAELGDVLKETTRAASASHSAGRLRSLLVVSEIALALVLLVGAGLMVKGFRNLLTSEMGFDRSRVLTFRIALPEEKYQTKTQRLAYYDRLTRQLQSLPGVTAVACLTSLPSGWTWNWTEYSAEGQPPAARGELPSAVSQVVTPDLLVSLRVPLLKGRFFSELDGPDAAPVAVISDSMARRNWPGQDPIGKHLKLGSPDSLEPDRRIVGVVGDVRDSAFDRGSDPAVYTPLSQVSPPSSAIVVRTSADPLSLVAPALEQIKSVDPEVPAFEVRSLEQVISDNTSGVESSARMMMAFGSVALVLAAAGIFGVMAYFVSQRTHEIGVRMALGARRVDVLRLVVSSAVKMAAVGLTIGVCVALALTYALSSLLFGVIRIDPPIFVLLTLLLATVAAVAAYIPARWAARIDPMQALRHE